MKRFRFLSILLISATLAFTACDNGGSDDTKADDAVVTISAIPGVTVPVWDAVPDTTAIDTDQYTGTIAWSPEDNPFVVSTVYTATITLTAKS